MSSTSHKLARRLVALPEEGCVLTDVVVEASECAHHLAPVRLHDDPYAAADAAIHEFEGQYGRYVGRCRCACWCWCHDDVVAVVERKKA